MDLILEILKHINSNPIIMVKVSSSKQYGMSHYAQKQQANYRYL